MSLQHGCAMMYKWSVSFIGPILICLGMMTISTVVYIQFVGYVWYLWPHWSFFVHAPISMFLTYGIYYFYIRTIVTSPGYVKKSELTESERARLMHDAKWAAKGESEYCAHCDQRKPPRSHHCAICERCVLHMDHHCPWINNCVGWKTHRTFVLFLAYLTIGCIYVLLCFYPFFLTWHLPSCSSRLSAASCIQIQLLIGLCASLSAGVLFGWQCYLVCTGQTTIETFMHARKRKKAEKLGETYVNPFDEGWRTNVRLFLGKNGVWPK